MASSARLSAFGVGAPRLVVLGPWTPRRPPVAHWGAAHASGVDRHGDNLEANDSGPGPGALDCSLPGPRHPEQPSRTLAQRRPVSESTFLRGVIRPCAGPQCARAAHAAARSPPIGRQASGCCRVGCGRGAGCQAGAAARVVRDGPRGGSEARCESSSHRHVERDQRLQLSREKAGAGQAGAAMRAQLSALPGTAGKLARGLGGRQ